MFVSVFHIKYRTSTLGRGRFRKRIHSRRDIKVKQMYNIHNVPDTSFYGFWGNNPDIFFIVTNGLTRMA